MCESKARSWFIVRHRGGGRIVHVVSAYTIGRARAHFGSLSEQYAFIPATWADIAKFTGLAPPTVNQETTYAADGLLMEWMGTAYSIEVAD